MAVERRAAGVGLQGADHDSQGPAQQDREQHQQRGGRPGFAQQVGGRAAVGDAGSEITPPGAPDPVEILYREWPVESQRVTRGVDLGRLGGGPQQPPHRIARGEVQQEEGQGHHTEHHGQAAQERSEHSVQHAENLAPVYT
jgi:hypothetical protein